MYDNPIKKKPFYKTGPIYLMDVKGDEPASTSPKSDKKDKDKDKDKKDQPKVDKVENQKVDMNSGIN
jgi:hypothetical protein